MHPAPASGSAERHTHTQCWAEYRRTDQDHTQPRPGLQESDTGTKVPSTFITRCCTHLLQKPLHYIHSGHQARRWQRLTWGRIEREMFKGLASGCVDHSHSSLHSFSHSKNAFSNARRAR